MFQNYYQLVDQPFGVTPDPRYLYQAGGVTQTTSLYEEVRLVKVKPNQTLIGICSETLGGYDEEILNRVRQLNPMLQDPSYIQSGTLIRIPSNRNTFEQIHPSPKQSPNALAADVEKP